MDSDSQEVKKTIHEKLLQGVVYRTSVTLIAWSFFASAYGFFSLDLLRKHYPTLTLFENIWPRFLFNSLPILAYGLWSRNYKKHTKVKAYLTVVALPVFLLIGSLIYAWPIFFSGDHNYYLFFHATNIIALASCLSLIAAPPGLVVAQALGFFIIYFGPLLFLFKNDANLANLIVSDVSLISFLLAIGLRMTHKLRFQLALEDIQRKNKAAPFLGENLAKAIYETKEMEIRGYWQRGLILALDLRGYTKFVHSTDPKTVKAFMADYHSAVTRVLGARQGYLHKTSGDGVLCSFGVMSKVEDLSDIPGIESDLKTAEQHRISGLFRLGIDTFNQIVREFELLKERHGVTGSLMIGAGVSCGDIEVVVRGDASFRQELDIDGEAIVRAVRLEAYSKLLNNMIDADSSFLVIAPELFSAANGINGSKLWVTNTPMLQVRDYPGIEAVMYRQWKHNRKRNSSGMAA